MTSFFENAQQRYFVIRNVPNIEMPARTVRAGHVKLTAGPKKEICEILL